MYNVVSPKKYIYTQHFNKCYVKKKFTSLIFRASKHAYVFMCARKGSFMHAHISRHKCIFMH